MPSAAMDPARLMIINAAAPHARALRRMDPEAGRAVLAAEEPLPSAGRAAYASPADRMAAKLGTTVGAGFMAP
jgi:hypothetical protein